MQSMSVQQLLQSPKAQSAKGEVVTDKTSLLQGILGDVKNQNVKLINGQNPSLEGLLQGETEGEELGNIDFSALFSEVQKNGSEVGVNPKTQIQNQNQANLKISADKNLNGKIASTNSNLDQLLNNLKGTNTEETPVLNENGEPVQNARKGFFPNQKVKPETNNESPLDFLVKGSKEKTFSLNEVPEELENSQQILNKNSPKAEFFPNKITNPASVEKLDTQEKTVKVLSGEDFVKNLKAATTPGKDILIGEQNKKMQAGIPTNIPQMKDYSRGQNILNDSMIRNTNDLAFKDTKKLKVVGSDELKTSETKVGNDLSMIKESPLAAIQLKASPIQENQIQGQTKVLDLSHMDPKNTNEIIKTISDYVEQNTVANKPSLDLTVKHDSLGQFKIQVSKMPNQNQVDMQITTSSSEGHKFFVQHESDLMRNLQQVGVNISDLRIVSSMKDATPFSQSESKQFSQFQHEQNGNSKQFMSFESGDFRDGAQKRKSLWQEYQERYGA